MGRNKRRRTAVLFLLSCLLLRQSERGGGVDRPAMSKSACCVDDVAWIAMRLPNCACEEKQKNPARKKEDRDSLVLACRRPRRFSAVADPSTDLHRLHAPAPFLSLLFPRSQAQHTIESHHLNAGPTARSARAPGARRAVAGKSAANGRHAVCRPSPTAKFLSCVESELPAPVVSYPKPFTPDFICISAEITRSRFLASKRSRTERIERRNQVNEARAENLPCPRQNAPRCQSSLFALSFQVAYSGLGEERKTAARLLSHGGAVLSVKGRHRPARPASRRQTWFDRRQTRHCCFGRRWFALAQPSYLPAPLGSRHPPTCVTRRTTRLVRSVRDVWPTASIRLLTTTNN